jgi:hypothetical protein
MTTHNYIAWVDGVFYTTRPVVHVTRIWGDCLPDSSLTPPSNPPSVLRGVVQCEVPALREL